MNSDVLVVQWNGRYTYINVDRLLCIINETGP